MYQPDGLLTTAVFKHDVDFEPHIIASDPCAPDDNLDDSPSDDDPFLLTTTDTDKIGTMNTSEDEPSLNGRLRPRKSTVPAIPSKAIRKSDGKSTLERSKRTSSPSKALLNKPDDLSLNKSESIPTQQQLLCPYCDRKFAYKQTVSKHVRRVHLSASKQDSFISCLFCNHNEAEPNEIIGHMVDSHPNQYFACLDCHTRFPSTSELAEHKLNVCEKQKPSYRNKLRQKTSTGPRKSRKTLNIGRKDEYGPNDGKVYPGRHGFNGIVISCELKPSQVHDEADIEDNITTNLILPHSKTLGNNPVLEKNAVIVLDDIQWNKRMPPNFTFHNTDADQILSRLGVVHRSPRTGESTRRDWFKSIDETTQKFEKCFDTSFYSKVASNVQENLAKFLDGSFNFNPDPDSTIKTRKSKNSVVINTAEGFPILLAYEQYSRNVFDGYMPRAIAPKHKWKWDNLENDKNIMNPDQIKRDSHANDCIITLVSSLDIWTQLCMKRKFEEKFSVSPVQKKTEKQNIIGKELKEILESRDIPTLSSQGVKYCRPTLPGSSLEFPALLGLTPAVPQCEVKPAVLSGEWVRPRCYVCCACGARTRDSRALSSHISTQHPNAQVQHYEVVGETLLNADIMQHLYVPPSQVTNRTRPMRGFRECTKCKKSVTLEELHQHMLDCAGDSPTVRRKCRYRPFGVRRRRPRLPDNTIRKKIRKDIRTRQRQKGHLRSRPRIRTEVGDAETIRKMIADLPAKRHRVMINPINSHLRPKKKLDKQRSNLIRKQRATDDQRIRRTRMRDTNRPLSTKETAPETKQASSNNDKDDDDNLPLKPRPKRMSVKTRPNEVFKRKTMISRAKRKGQSHLKKSQDLNPTEQASNEQMSLSRDNLPQRVDVNGGPVNAREHAGRGAPTNRGAQPGGSRQENNPNNAHAPVQNAPLKHSIASLTADSETHDKSVQFHHLFLVQQECNNVTQHVPTGRQQLFENEAAVTRLDKPPLAYQKPQLDPTSLQKCKLNKPRKGLNDCIAMLKNKLVDPISPSTGQVSVQCGSDEPLDMEPIMMAPRVVPLEQQIDLRPAEIYSRHSLPVPEKVMEIKPIRSSRNRSATAQRSSSISLDVTQKEIIKISSKKPSLTLEVIPPKQKQATTPVKRKSSRLRSVSCISQEQNVHAQLTSLSPRLDATHASQMAQALLLRLPQLPQVTQIPKGFNDISLAAFKTSYISRNVTETQKKTNRTRSRREASKKSEIVTDIPIKHSNRPTEVNIVNQTLVRKSLTPESRPELRIENEPERAISKVPLTDQRSPEIFNHASTVMSKSCSSFSDDNNYFPPNPPELLPRQGNRRISDDIYVTPNFSDIPAGIPPAHSSTSIEYVTSAPLDLSGKPLPLGCNETHPKLDNSYTVHTYDAYETLDLSNKRNCSDVCLEINAGMGDVIVDLRIKSSEAPQSKGQNRSLDSCIKLGSVIDSNSIKDLSMRSREEEYVPTDLSMKRKYSTELTQISTDNLNYHVQDLSGHKTFVVEECKTCSQTLEVEKINLTEDVPTDLSGKKTEIISTSVASDAMETDIATQISVDLTLKNITEDCPTDLSGKTSTVTIELSTETVQENKDIEITKSEDESKSTSNTMASASNSTSKPVYDPTLRIPQYKIKTTSTTEIATKPLNVNSEVLPHTIVGTEFPTTAVIPGQSFYVGTSTQEKLSYCFKSSMNLNTIAGSIPIYSYPNTGPSMPVCRYESTKPVYTLANACISVTKIESSSSATLTNTLLSIPGTTIASTTSVYTLAGTTVGAPMTYGGIIPPLSQKNAPAMKPIISYDGQTSSSIDDKDIENAKKIINDNAGVEQDPETAKKIAMLPKELVEILGTMPAGHRNQLLNVLPQYVSTSAPPSGCTSQDEVTVQNVANIQTSLSCDNSKLHPFRSEESLKTTGIIISSMSTKVNNNSTTPNQFTSLVENVEGDNKHSLTLSLDPCTALQNQRNSSSEDIKPPLSNISENTGKPCTHIEKGKEYLNQTTGTSSNILENKFISEPTIIDLTEDENCELVEVNVNLSEEMNPQPAVQLPTEEFSVETVRQKSSNKNTASLRAVRIKAPSERNKPNVIDLEVSKTVVDIPLNSNLNENAENEGNKLLDSDTTLAIQQAEISSTQHNTKNMMVNCKSTSVSPVNLESAPEVLRGEKPLPTIPEMAVKTNKDSLSDMQTPMNTKNEEAVLVKPNDVHNILTPSFVDICSENSKAGNETIAKGIVKGQDSSQVTNTCVIDFAMQNSIHVQNILPINNKINDPSRPDDDEDSEDDISLATILKQKRLDQQKPVLSEETLQSQNDNYTKKKKTKKLKRSVSKIIETEDSLKLSAGQPILNENKNGGTLFDDTNLDNFNNCNLYKTKSTDVYSNSTGIISTESSNTGGKQVKNKFMKLTTINAPEITNDQEGNAYIAVSHEKDLNKEIVKRSKDTVQNTSNNIHPFCEEVPILETVLDTYKSSDMSDCKSVRIEVTENPEYLTVSNENEQFSTTTKSQEIDFIESVKRKIECTKAELSDDTISCNTKESLDKKKLGVCDKRKSSVCDKRKTAGCNRNTDNNEVEIKTIVDKELTMCHENVVQKDSVPVIAEAILNDGCNHDITKPDQATCIDKLENNESVRNINMIIREEEKQTANPLRRSRRGKSMFVEHVAEDNILIAKISPEHKTPLTKKQLIFSKLLLDEENQPNISPPSEKFTNIENESCMTNTVNVNLNSECQSSAKTLSNNNECKKPVKRKKSPQTKRRNKKKKSLDSPNFEEDIDNSQSIDNDMAPRKKEENNRKNDGEHIKQSKEKVIDSQISSEQPIFKSRANDEHNLIITVEKTDALETPSSATEKRKVSLPTVTADIGHLPKIKKTKLNKNKDLLESESLRGKNINAEENSSKLKDKSFASSEIRTACYNRPAARRTRSKSVFVKSSVNESYDPYDIELDDMIEKLQPFSKKNVESHTENLRHSVGSTIRKDNKQDTKVIELTQLTNDNNSSNQPNVKLKAAIDDVNHISDSDDSSKSDVPLKKYMEEKEKKLQLQEERLVQIRENDDDFDVDHSEMSDDKLNEKEDRKSRRTLAVFNNVDAVATCTTESEEQLRSEQFMESFGFFSERKPRKSNLLASKKISETFHIIANDSEDMFYGAKDRSVKKSLQNENRKSVEDESSIKTHQHSPIKKAAKRGRKKKSCTKIVPCYCAICKKEFRRSDNYLRHQISLHHISKLSEVEMKVKTAPVPEEPNYLIVYKQHLDRLKILTDKLAKRKKNSKSAPKITLPTMEEIVAEVNKTVRDQQLSQRGLSRDEALFLDCCELLKESHKNDLTNTEVKIASDLNAYACGTQTEISELDLITTRLNEDGTKSDGDVDSITAKNILESEEVRNLENDLISGLKEAANASNAKNIAFPRSIDDIIDSQQIHHNFSSSEIDVHHYNQIEESFEHLQEPPRKPKKHTEVKEKMYPDIIENIDMFEDKFDKIKRKCRSQAAAAKQAQLAVETTSSYKGRKRSDKKKGKKSSKKNHQSTQVLTKGALKGFDGIKVSIPTSDINMSAIVPPLEVPTKKKKKNSSKKKREKKDSESSGKYDSDHRAKDNSTTHRKVDVYEFMDNEDAELFEFRPSTLMERFKSMSNKDAPSTSKFNPVSEDISSDSISDGDDFVYMSDDYVCSDDETENSLMSCELSVGKINTEVKKNLTSLKRKDVFEKNAVMGKIFKHNAVRTEKKSTKLKETVKPKTNLDQLFDSLLEEEPSSSLLNSDATSPRNEDFTALSKQSPSYYDTQSCSRKDVNKLHSKDPKSSSRRCGISSSNKDQDIDTDKFDFTSSKRYDKNFDLRPSNFKIHDDVSTINYGPSTSRKPDIIMTTNVQKSSSPKKHESTAMKKYDCTSSKTNKLSKYRVSSPELDDESLEKFEEASTSKKLIEDTGTSFDQSGEQLEPYCYDETGVARQRARRKCTVGKQNVLAETWSSESEPDGQPPRPNSTESVVLSGGRRRRGKKKEGSQSGSRRGSSRQVIFRRQDVESRVTSGSGNAWSGGTRGSSGSRESATEAGEGEESLEGGCAEAAPASPPPAAATPAATTSKARPRAAAYYWSSEGDEEQEHLQQHGWIVGDSHKKLVTMLAHAKGRKRNNDDKRPSVE